MAKKKSNKRDKKKARGLGGSAGNYGGSLLQGLGGIGRNEQFLLGAVIGAAAMYVLSDEEMRGKLMKTGLSLYSGLSGGIAELKERIADFRAEAASDQTTG